MDDNPLDDISQLNLNVDFSIGDDYSDSCQQWGKRSKIKRLLINIREGVIKYELITEIELDFYIDYMHDNSIEDKTINAVYELLQTDMDKAVQKLNPNTAGVGIRSFNGLAN